MSGVKCSEVILHLIFFVIKFIFLFIVNTFSMKKALPIAVIVVLILFALNLEITRAILSKIGVAFSPLLIGGFFALLLKAPVDFFEKTLLSSPKLGKAKRPLSLTLSLFFSVGFIVLISYLVLPELLKSAKALKESLEWLLAGGLEERLPLPKSAVDWLKKALEKGLASTESLLPNLIEGIGHTLKGIVNALLGIMLAVTTLSGSTALGDFVEKISLKIFGKKRSDFFKGALSAVVEKFSKYLSGSVVEAVIFSVVCYLAFIIFKLPYPLLLAAIVGIFNLVPTIGGYLGGGIGVLILITISWKTALIFVAIMLVLQQVEQVTTYPIVVGRYVGLSPFFVLVAVVLGGGLFGFWGLLLGVPVVAFIYNLINVLVNSKPCKDEIVQN